MMLGHGLWQRAFGGDPEIVGKTVRLAGSSWRELLLSNRMLSPATVVMFHTRVQSTVVTETIVTALKLSPHHRARLLLSRVVSA